MNLREADVVVVGAGVAGMAAAILLARAGASVTLLDWAAHAVGPDTAAIVGPGGFAVLTTLDLPLRLEPRAAGTRAVRYQDLRTALLASIRSQQAIAYRVEATGWRPIAQAASGGPGGTGSRASRATSWWAPTAAGRRSGLAAASPPGECSTAPM